MVSGLRARGAEVVVACEMTSVVGKIGSFFGGGQVACPPPSFLVCLFPPFGNAHIQRLHHTVRPMSHQSYTGAAHSSCFLLARKRLQKSGYGKLAQLETFSGHAGVPCEPDFGASPISYYFRWVPVGTDARTRQEHAARLYKEAVVRGAPAHELAPLAKKTRARFHCRAQRFASDEMTVSNRSDSLRLWVHRLLDHSALGLKVITNEKKPFEGRRGAVRKSSGDR